MNSNGKISLKKIVKNVLTIGTIYYIINNVLRTDTQHNRITCGCSSVVEHQPSKLDMWVRFPSPALFFYRNSSAGFSRCGWTVFL